MITPTNIYQDYNPTGSQKMILNLLALKEFERPVHLRLKPKNLLTKVFKKK